MKKFFSIIITAFFAVQFVSAQTKITPVVGLNVATYGFTNGEGDYKIPDDEKPEFKSRLGLQIGALAEFSLGEKLIFSPGLIFSQKGAKTEGSFTESDDGIELKVTTKANFGVNYLEIPLNLGYRLNLGESAEIDLLVGPYIGYALGGKLKADVETSVFGRNISVSTSADIKGGKEPERGTDNTVYVNPLDLGLNVGANVVLNKTINIGLFYGLGLSNTTPQFEKDPEGYERSKDSKIRNRVLQFRVGYSFGGKK